MLGNFKLRQILRNNLTWEVFWINTLGYLFLHIALSRIIYFSALLIVPESWKRGSAACHAFLSLFPSFPLVSRSETFKKHFLKTEGLSIVNCLIRHSKWFEPWSISSSYCVIVRVSVVLNRTVVGDRRFDNLSGIHLQSQVKQCLSVDGVISLVR